MIQMGKGEWEGTQGIDENGNFIDILPNYKDKTLFNVLNQQERITFTVQHGRTKQTVKVILEGNGVCCKNIRDLIVVGWPKFGWTQGSLKREKREE